MCACHHLGVLAAAVRCTLCQTGTFQTGSGRQLAAAWCKLPEDCYFLVHSPCLLQLDYDMYNIQFSKCVMLDLLHQYMPMIQWSNSRQKSAVKSAILLHHTGGVATVHCLRVQPQCATLLINLFS
jgi:hypothetical protein